MSEGSESRLLAGRYRLGERLGRGGMATVYRATDELLGRDVAVKLLDLHTASDESAAARFRREARATAALSHPHIVTVFDTGLDGDDAFLVMELLPGPTLSDELRERGQLPVAEVIRVGIQVAGALAAAHDAGIVHRDIKPGNIARTADGGVKVLDFGITQLLDDSLDTAHGPLTIPDSVIGTAQYLSPEQATGQRVDHRADLYALGCVLFALLAGRAPFKGDTAVATLMLQTTAPAPDVRDLRPDTPAALAELIGQLLAKDPAARPASAREVAERLRRASTHVATTPSAFPADATARTAVLPAAAAGAGVAAAAAADLGAAAGGPPSGASGTGVTPTRGGPTVAHVPDRPGPSRRSSPAGPVAIVLVVLLLAAAGVWALLHFQPGVTPARPTPVQTSAVEPTTESPPPAESPKATSPTVSPSVEPTTPEPPPESPPVTTPPAQTTPPVSSSPPADSSPADSPEALAVIDAAGALLEEVDAAVGEGVMTENYRKDVVAGLKALEKGLKKEDTQATSDALSAIDQSLSDSGAKDEVGWWYDDLKAKVDAWSATLP